ncbi:MAG TPA: hypothetical protein VM431_11195 [Phycisphaerae bacterium]|nr:hypothetical protein [Phycisphaerae bacterium]
MSVADRARRAELMWAAGDGEGALDQLLLGIAATSRKRYPKSTVPGDGEAFVRFVEDEIRSGLFFGPHVTEVNFAMPWRGKSVSLAEILYQIRCSTVHEGALPADVHYAPGGEPHLLVLRIDDTTGAFVFQDTLLRCLDRCVHNVPENATELDPLPVASYTGPSVTSGPGGPYTVTASIIELAII